VNDRRRLVRVNGWQRVLVRVGKLQYNPPDHFVARAAA